MTRLVKLTIKNFKSFKKAEIPISKGFTAIVGSNGSGKSNVLDALLFVLGITSLKTLRATKLTDLVNNNCKEGYAKVDILVKHNEKQYEISRMIDRQGKSVYRLDGKRTTLNEINSLLLELGIDITGHNIVTQGDITKIIEMSPMERRNIIDNIAGLSEFDQKKEEALKELEKVDSRIKEATIIMNERNSFLSELEEEMKAAKEFADLEKEKKRIKSTVIGRELYNIEKRMTEILTEISELEKTKQGSDDKVTEMRKELSELKTKSNEMNRQIMKESESLYTTIGRSLEEKKGKLALEKEKISLQEDIFNSSTKKLEVNKKTLESSENQKVELKTKISETKNEIKEIESTIRALSEKKGSLEKVVKQKDAEARKYENEIEQFNKQIEEERKILFDLEVFAKQWEKQKNYSTKRLSETEAELKETEEKMSKIIEKKKAIEQLTNGKDLSLKIEQLEKEYRAFSEKRNKAIAQMDEAKTAVEGLNKANAKCPICEADLQEQKKSQIIGHKSSHITELNKEATAINQQMENLLEQIEKEKKNLMESTKLKAECGAENELTQKKNSLLDAIRKLKEELDQKGFDEKISERNTVEEKVKKLAEERERIRQNLAAFRSQNIFEEYSSLNSTIEDNLNQRSLLESKISDVENELNKILAKEESISKENKENEKALSAAEKEINERKETVTKLEIEVGGKEVELKEAKKKSAAFLSEKEKLDKQIERDEKEIIIESTKARKVELRINDFNIEKSKIEVRESDLKEERKGYENEEQISEKGIDELKKRLEIVEKKLLEIGAVNLKAVDNFNELKREVDDIQQKAGKLNDERLAVLDMIDKIEVKRTAVFMDCFNEVNKNFVEMFFSFFGGEGKLTFTDPEKPLDSGLLIEAKHKMNRLQNIDSMSGGEKTLTALAFMFAIQLYSPAPFYAFDEADAALDKENSAKMGNLIEKIAEKSQFVSVTHNDTITKKADQIIGVALAKDGSSVIGLKLKNQQED